jgi:hypothetical protein
VLREGRVEEREVEAHVVPDDHATADELEERRQHRGDRRCGRDHAVGDAGQTGDERGDGGAGVHERLELALAHARPVLHCAHLGDGSVAR